MTDQTFNGVANGSWRNKATMAGFGLAGSVPTGLAILLLFNPMLQRSEDQSKEYVEGRVARIEKEIELRALNEEETTNRLDDQLSSLTNTVHGALQVSAAMSQRIDAMGAINNTVIEDIRRQLQAINTSLDRLSNKLEKN